MRNAKQIFIDYRKKTGLTQAEMAKAFGTSQGNVSKIENGELIPNADIVLRILSKDKRKGK